MTRRRAGAAELEACKRRFWEGSALFALRRAAQRVRAGEAVDEHDRERAARKLEHEADLEQSRIKAMTPARLRAYLADYLQRELGITAKEAMAACAGEYTIGAVKQHLKAIRRLRGRKGTR